MEKAKFIEVDIRSGWKDAEEIVNKELEKIGDAQITARKLVPTPSGKAHVMIMYRADSSKKTSKKTFLKE